MHPYGLREFETFQTVRATGDWAWLEQEWQAHEADYRHIDNFDVEAAKAVLAPRWRPRMGEAPRPLAQLEHLGPPRVINGALEERLGPYGPKDGKTLRLTNAVRQGAPWRTAARPGHFTHTILESLEPVGDFEFAMDFSIRLNGEPHAKWPTTLNISILQSRRDGEPVQLTPGFWDGPHHLLGFRLQVRAPEPEQVTTLQVRSDGVSQSTHLPTPGVALDGTTLHRLRMARVGGIGQIEFDGQTLLLMPLDLRDTELALFIHGVGFSFDVPRSEWMLYGDPPLPGGLVRRGRAADADGS